jgi:benzoate-CoA ligase
MAAAGEMDLTAGFNFAAYLIELNSGLPSKTAYIDDHGILSYGDLGRRIRKLAAALLALGIRREERVLLLMQDTRDWPVCFLGSMYAGIVPVAVNTLLTADDYAYMLQNSRAQAVLVSAALLPALEAAMNRGGHEVRWVIVSRPASSNDPRAVSGGPSRRSRPAARPGQYVAGRLRVLALLLGFDRQAQRHRA